jgi:transposase
MLTLPGGVRIYACTAPCDTRKQIDGLAALVQHGLGHDAQSGHLFMAFNRRGDMVRILFWDKNGFVLVSKRLEAGTFALPWQSTQEQSSFELDAEQLARILEGVEVHGCTCGARKAQSPSQLHAPPTC